MNDLPAGFGGEPAKQTPYGRWERYGVEEIDELAEAVRQQTLFYASGRKVKQLESDFAAKLGARHAIATSSGTASIHAALIAAGISPGDEVIVSPITDMGTVAPILFQGAVPVFADLDPSGHVLDPGDVARRITRRTKAVLAVHLWGNACDLDALGALCDEHGIHLIEDCAQAFGATWRGRPVGTIAPMGCFSLNEFKHISCGDGGIVVTDDDDLAVRLRLATDKGYDRRPDALIRQPTFLCNNYRMTELQGAVAVAQLRKLDAIVARRREFAEGLRKRLTESPGLLLPTPTPGADPSWWFFFLRIDPVRLGVDAKQFAALLGKDGIRASPNYIGVPIYRYPIFADHSAFPRGGHAYERQCYRAGDCPEAEAILDTGVQIPVSEGFTETDLEEVAHGVDRLCRWLSTHDRYASIA
ncbi:MAG: DegT/DnrJ/EryC1/StrS family aminotransferase [Armatimonadota bacterium]